MQGLVIRKEWHLLQCIALNGLLLEVDVVLHINHQLSQLHQLPLHLALELPLLPRILFEDGVESAPEDDSYIALLHRSHRGCSTIVHVQERGLSNDGPIPQLADIAAVGGDLHDATKQNKHGISPGALLHEVAIRSVLLPVRRDDEIPNELVVAILEDLAFGEQLLHTLRKQRIDLSLLAHIAPAHLHKHDATMMAVAQHQRWH
mmetsp:Transcript_79375/g.199407  ORF Transcript_79375/g.199407 Transcript_79375/m.199407 type:complete len:204 (-) Transcript_79375:24-635(-)